MHSLSRLVRRPAHRQFSRVASRPQRLDHDLVHAPRPVRFHSLAALRLASQLLQRHRALDHQLAHRRLLSHAIQRMGREQNRVQDRRVVVSHLARYHCLQLHLTDLLANSRGKHVRQEEVQLHARPVPPRSRYFQSILLF